MKTTQLQVERLRQFAEYLIRYQKKFKKDTYVYVPLHTDTAVLDKSETYYLYPMRETVKVFPGEWRLNENGSAYWIHDLDKDTYSSAMNFFGLYSFDFCHLFILGGQNPVLFGGKLLTTNTAPNEIAMNILEFIKAFGSQEN